jgi:hypothetical protein
MPRPGVVNFDDNDITDFLRRWNIECENFGRTDTPKRERIPYYCCDEIKELIECLEGHAKPSVINVFRRPSCFRRRRSPPPFHLPESFLLPIDHLVKSSRIFMLSVDPLEPSVQCAFRCRHFSIPCRIPLRGRSQLIVRSSINHRSF